MRLTSCWLAAALAGGCGLVRDFQTGSTLADPASGAQRAGDPLPGGVALGVVPAGGVVPPTGGMNPPAPTLAQPPTVQQPPPAPPAQQPPPASAAPPAPVPLPAPPQGPSQGPAAPTACAPGSRGGPPGPVTLAAALAPPLGPPRPLPDPHIRPVPTVVGGRLALGPGDVPADRVVELSIELDALLAQNRELLARIKDLEAAGAGREAALEEARREIDAVTASAAKTRAALEEQAAALQAKLRQLEDDDVAFLRAALEALGRLLPPEKKP
jgi:hypothetical protein